MTFIGCATRDDVTGDPFYGDGGDDGDDGDGGDGGDGCDGDGGGDDMCQGLEEVLNVWKLD